MLREQLGVHSIAVCGSAGVYFIHQRLPGSVLGLGKSH